ncbi:MAG: hypothetical protein ACR2NK_13380 [Mariniblastus sp.]
MRSNLRGKPCRSKTLLFIMVGFASTLTGCKNSRPILQKFEPPQTIAAENKLWSLVETGASESDNRKIDSFFKNRPDLLGSPEWDGQPEKYIGEDSKDRTRLYWFSGSLERPVWNGLEFNGRKMSLFSGIGNPKAG